MSFPNVSIVQKKGSNGKQAAGFDFYSGLVFYGSAPMVAGKWTQYPGPPIIKAQQMFSETDATSAGIIPFTDNTAATATYLILTAATVAGETLPISVEEPNINSTSTLVSLGKYITVVGDTVIDTLGANLVVFINGGTVTHGYSASYNAGTNTLSIFSPKSKGISLNTGTPLDIDQTGTTVTGTITQFSGGTSSQWSIWFYHISEYFRINPTGNLWVGIISASVSFTETKTLQTASANKLRQIGIYDISGSRGDSTSIIGTVLSLNTALLVLQAKSPMVGIYSPNIAFVSDLSTYPDQNSNTANKVNMIICQDGGAAGALLFVQNGQTVGNIGVALGALSKSRVSASWSQAIDDFNMSDGTENNIMAFGNGDLSDSITEGLQTQLDNYRYTFFRNFGSEVVGTYFTDNKCCVAQTSDLAYLNDNRVADKIGRICYSTYIPLLNSELIFNTDGTLQDYTIEVFTQAGIDAITANMITGFGNLPLISGVSVSIDATQPVKQTNNLTIVVNYIENGIARQITVEVASVNKLS